VVVRQGSKTATSLVGSRAVQKGWTRARQTTAAATARASARPREEKLRVAIAGMAFPTTAQRDAKPPALYRHVASTTVPAPTNLARAAGIPTVVAEAEIQDAMSVTCTRK